MIAATSSLNVLAQPTNLLQFRGSAVLIMDDIAWEIRA
jgi:hypothetical protein